MVPFFGELATANTSISQLGKVSGAPILPFFSQRMENGKRYEIRFQAPLDNFPSGDMEADAIRVNQLLEEQIRKTITPDQANYDGNSVYADGPKGVFREETTAADSFARIPEKYGKPGAKTNGWPFGRAERRPLAPWDGWRQTCLCKTQPFRGRGSQKC